MAYNFDGTNKLITITTTGSFEAIDLYSRWKDWVSLSDNSKYIQAFRGIGGDPIGGGQNIAAAIFLNNLDGWKIRPAEANHELRIVGNLYAENTAVTMFTSTLGSYTVNVLIDRSSNALSLGTGLTTNQSTMLSDLFKLAGLDVTKPLIVTPVSRSIGTDIKQNIIENGTTITVQRV